MRKHLLLTFLCIAVISLSGLSQQERPPQKDFRFEISVSHLKKQEQVDKVVQEFSRISGVKNLEFELIDYAIVFNCTNHDLKDHMILDKLKAIVSKNGIQIEQVNRKDLSL